jgi:hypothetical protein
LQLMLTPLHLALKEDRHLDAPNGVRKIPAHIALGKRIRFLVKFSLSILRTFVHDSHVGRKVLPLLVKRRQKVLLAGQYGLTSHFRFLNAEDWSPKTTLLATKRFTNAYVQIQDCAVDARQ